MQLSTKTAFITGAASGIGEAITRRFIAEGARVWAADRDPEGLKRLQADLDDWGTSAELVVLDIADLDAIKTAAEAVHKAIPHGLDILVNNAGIGAVGTALETSVSELDRLHAVNVRGPYELSRQFLPAMLARKSGVIINLASIGGIVGLRDRAAYCTTKFAVVGMTKAMALDHAAAGVRINCICPARVETPFVAARIKEYPDPEKAYRDMSATQPIGRMARPEEVAAAAVYLASDDAQFMTGSAHILDGGLSAGV